MYLLFPSDMYDKRIPDPDFADEAGAARDAGFAIVLYHMESLRDGDLRRALIATGNAPETDAPILYRG